MKKQPIDPWLLIIILFLTCIGIILVYSSTYSFSYSKLKDPYIMFNRHLVGIGMGVAAMLFFFLVPVEFFKKYIRVIIALAVVLLIMAVLPFTSKNAGGASRWVDLGFFSFQPSEISKLVIVFYLAYILEKKQDRIKDFMRGSLGPFIVCGIFAGVILMQKNFSTSVFIMLLAFTMLYVGGAKFINVLISIVVTALVLLPFIFTSGYRLNRIKMLLNYENDPQQSYQLFQSIEAFKKGGVLGEGFGKGVKAIPYPFNDFIYSVAGEEMGLIGTLIILLLFMFLWYRGMLIAKRFPERSFESILAYGLTFMIVLQALMNIAVALAIVFPTGITLPFISYGRTSFIVFCAAAGMLFQLSRRAKEEEAEGVGGFA